MAEQDQEIQYRVVVDRSDVHQAADEIDQLAQKAASSVSALSSNMLTNAAQVSLNAAQGPTTLMPGSALAPGMMAAYMASQQQGATFAPGAALAQDAFMQQAMMAGPSPMSLGPSMTTPFGDPTINMFRNPMGAPSFQVPMDFLAANAPPGAPGDPRRSRFVFGTGEGSVWDMGRMALSRGLFGYIANDNLEDRMFRSIERRMQYGAQNLTDIERFLINDVGMGGLGSLAGGMLGSALGPAGTLAGSIAGGVAGAGIGAGLDATIGRLSRPYEEMANSFSQYTAPFIRGERLGGGMSFRERIRSQRDIAKRVAADNWFNTKEYQDLINIAGETGVFQFTGSEKQAMDAVDKLGKSVKTLYALGIKSRDMLKTIDQSLGTFGVSPSTDPQSMANFYMTMATTAQSAGMSTSRLSDVVAPAAQMFASQGIGMQAGARIAMENMGIAGEMFRRGGMTAFDNAYFGGAEGLGQTLTQATATMYRTPVGQALLSSMFAPGGRNLQAVLGGQTLSVTDIVQGAGGYASDPLRYVGMQALMPKMTQELGPELQGAMLNTLTQTFREMFGEQGAIDPERFLGFMVQMGIPENQAMALYEMIGKAGSSAEGIRRSARDQMNIQRIEGLRGPTIGRRIEKLRERTVDQWADNFMTGVTEFNANVMKGVEEMITGVHTYDIGANGQTAAESPFKLRSELLTAAGAMKESGLGTLLYKDLEEVAETPEVDVRQELARNRERFIGDLLAKDKGAERRFIDAAKAKGLSDEEIENALSIARTGESKPTPLSTGSRAVIQSAAETVTGLKGKEAEAALAQDAKLQEQVVQRTRSMGIAPAEVSAYATGGMVVTPAGQQGPGTVKAALIDSLLSTASAPEGLSVKNQQNRGDYQGLIDLLGRDKSVKTQVDALRTQLVKNGQFTEQEMLDFFQVGGAKKVSLTPEKQAEAMAIFGEVAEKRQQFQNRNLDFFTGVKAFDDGMDQNFSLESKTLADQLVSSYGVDKVRSLISTQVGDEQKNVDAMVKLVMGDDAKYDKLSLRDRAKVGAVTKAISNQLGDKSAEGVVLKNMTEGGKQAVKDEKALTLEQLERARKNILKGEPGDDAESWWGSTQKRRLNVDADVKAALDVGGTEGMANAGIVQNMAILRMAKDSDGDWGDFTSMLKQAGISTSELDALGIEESKFRNFGDFQADLARKISDAVDDTSGSQHDRLVKAQAAMNAKSFLGFGKQISGSDTFRMARGLERNSVKQMKAAEAGGLRDTERERIIQRIGVDKLGDDKVDDLLKGLNNATGDNMAGMGRLVEALEESPDALRKLGVTGSYLRDMQGALKDIGSGGVMNVDTVQRLLMQTDASLSKDEAKAQAQQNVANYQSLVNRNRHGEARDQMAALLKTSLSHSMKKGDGYLGMGANEISGVIGGDSVQAMQQAVAQQERIAQQLEQIASNFSPNKSDGWVSQVKEFKQAVEGDGGFSKGVDKFEGAVTAFSGLPKAIDDVLKKHGGGLPAANVQNGGTKLLGAEATPKRPK